MADAGSKALGVPAPPKPRRNPPPPPYARLRRSVYLGAWATFRPREPAYDTCGCRVACGPECINRQTLTECGGGNCSLGKHCGNRALQRGTSPPLAVRVSPGKGWGLFAKTDIPRDSFIAEYVGEVIDLAEAMRRMAEYKANNEPAFFMMEISAWRGVGGWGWGVQRFVRGGGGWMDAACEETPHPPLTPPLSCTASNQYLDARTRGNPTRFANHSCEPNAVAMRWSVPPGYTRIGIWSTKLIRAGDEICYDYEFLSAAKTPCMCGTPRCRGLLGSDTKTELASMTPEQRAERTRIREKARKEAERAAAQERAAEEAAAVAEATARSMPKPKQGGASPPKQKKGVGQKRPRKVKVAPPAAAEREEAAAPAPKRRPSVGPYGTRSSGLFR